MQYFLLNSHFETTRFLTFHDHTRGTLLKHIFYLSWTTPNCLLKHMKNIIHPNSYVLLRTAVNFLAQNFGITLSGTCNYEHTLVDESNIPQSYDKVIHESNTLYLLWINHILYSVSFLPLVRITKSREKWDWRRTVSNQTFDA